MGTEHVLLIHSFQEHGISGSVGGAEGKVREQDKEAGDGEDAAWLIQRRAASK